MSEMKDKSRATDHFDAIGKKQRGLLTKEERHVIALKKAADQAAFEFRNCAAVVAKQSDRAKVLEEAAVRAKAAFEKAQAELEAKSE